MANSAPKSFDAAFRSIQAKKARQDEARAIETAKEAIPIAATGAPKVNRREFRMITTEANYPKFLTERSNRRQHGASARRNLENEASRIIRKKT